MTAPGDPRTGRKWMALARWVIARDNGICWRCGRPGAETCGHILPVRTHPHLALDPDNLRAEHGRKRTVEVHGFDCIGNFAAGADTGDLGGDRNLSEPRRDWLARNVGAALTRLKVAQIARSRPTEAVLA